MALSEPGSKEEEEMELGLMEGDGTASLAQKEFLEEERAQDDQARGEERAGSRAEDRAPEMSKCSPAQSPECREWSQCRVTDYSGRQTIRREPCPPSQGSPEK